MYPNITPQQKKKTHSSNNQKTNKKHLKTSIDSSKLKKFLPPEQNLQKSSVNPLFFAKGVRRITRKRCLVSPM